EPAGPVSGVGDRVMDLAEIRRDLGALLGGKLNVVAPDYGGIINPPCVMVVPGRPYLTPSTYDSERVNYDVWLIAGPGETAARLDALDGMVDQVRTALRSLSSKGLRFGWIDVDPPDDFDGQMAAIVHVIHERDC